jgi:ATP-dependent Clp protease protease subunit
VSTIAVGQTASMATVLLCAGAKGKRYALPNATVHMHQALGGARGQASDIEIAAKEILRNNEMIRKIIATHTGQPEERVSRDYDRDFYLDAQGAKEYGFVDEILDRPEDKKSR